MKQQLSMALVAMCLTTAVACSDSNEVKYTVTAKGEHVSFSPADPVSVAQGGTASFDVSADDGYQLLSKVRGDCPQGEWSDGKYTTGPITANCSVSFSAASAVARVTAVGTGVDIEPKGVQTVALGSTLDFDVAALTGYKRDDAVAGSCAQGSWSGDIYTTGPITGDCSVTFSASLKSFDVTTSGTNVTLSPSGVQKVLYGSALTLAVTTSEGYTRSNTVTGTCPAGVWSGNSYTTGVIISACTVAFSATLNAYQVISSGSHVTIAPSGTQTVAHGKPLEFTVTADEHYTRSSTVGGTCPAGTWDGDVYTTGLIIGECSVSFSATLNEHTVSSTGTRVSVSPAGDQTMPHGSSVTYTVTPDFGTTLSPAVGGDCPAGTWSGNAYTTGPIEGPCAVSFGADWNVYTIDSSGTALTISPSGPQTAIHGTTLEFTVTPDSGLTRSDVVGGTCPEGSWNGDVYTTGVILGDCSVSFLAGYKVNVVGTNVTRDPDGVQVVASGEALAVTVTAEAGHTLHSAVGGTCPAGSWDGAVYTTGAVTAECTVSFSANTVFLYSGGIYYGHGIGDRAEATAKCQGAHGDVPRGFSNLACTHFVPLLGYAPNGVTDLTQAPYLVPTSRKFVGPTGTLIADDWDTLINLSSGVSGMLRNASVLGTGNTNSYFAWTGFSAGGAVTADTCGGWSVSGASGNSIVDVGDGWSGTVRTCKDYILSIMCMCWSD